MGLLNLAEKKGNGNPKGEVSRSSGKYPKKTKPKPDPDEFSHSREVKGYVGPPLEEIGGIEELINRVKSCESIEDWSFLLNDYIKWGNNSKVDSSVGIFNLGAAHDCPNRFEENCQVGGDECYAVEDEKMYPYVLDFYRRQEYLWDCMTAHMFSESLKKILSRKRSEVVAMKFGQAGDFRHEGDIIKLNQIAESLSTEGVMVYTYSASNYLNWDHARSSNLVVNQSNSIEEYGDRRYYAVESQDQIPEDVLWCPYNKQEVKGVSPEERTKCGECTACIDNEAGDIAVLK